MNPSFVIAIHEFKHLVFRWGFFIKIVGAPFFVLAYIALLGVLGIGVEYFFSTKPSPIGFVNESPLPFTLPAFEEEGQSHTFTRAFKTSMIGEPEQFTVKLYSSRDAAQKAIVNDEIPLALIIDPSFLSNASLTVLKAEDAPMSANKSRRKLNHIIQDTLFKQYDLPKAIQKGLQLGFEVKTLTIRTEGVENESEEEEIPLEKQLADLMNNNGHFIFIGLILSVLFANTERFSRSATRERESKLLDVLLTSASPEQYILGKIMGIVSASLVQFGIWIGFFYSIPLLVKFFLKLPIHIPITLYQFIISSLFSLCGMVFFGALVTACTYTKREADQPSLMKIWLGLFMIGSLWILVILLSRSDGALWHIMSLVPLFTPFLQIVQIGDSSYSFYYAWGFFIYMVICTAIMIRLAGHIFRVGLNIEGQELSLLIKAKLLFRRNS